MFASISQAMITLVVGALTLAVPSYGVVNRGPAPQLARLQSRSRFQVHAGDAFQPKKPSKDMPQQFVKLLEQERNGSRLAIESRFVNRLDLKGGNLTERHRGAFPTNHSNTGAIKLIIWTPVLSYQKELQEAHRKTWMTQPGVCSVDQHANPNCHVFPVWVYGNATADNRKAALEAANGIAQTVFNEDIPEPPLAEFMKNQFVVNAHGGRSQATVKNMNLKTPFAIKHAHKNFRWATHFARLDLDAWPWVSTILDDLEKLPRRGLVYGPRDRFNEPENCQTGVVSGFFSCMSFDVLDCWVAQEARKEAARDWRQAQWVYPMEDVIFSNMLFDAQKDGTCPRLTCANIRGANRVIHPVR